jgi:hypothetical protein
VEYVFAFIIVLLSFLGIGLGLLLTGRPPKGSCGGLACVEGLRCGGCRRHAEQIMEEDDG